MKLRSQILLVEIKQQAIYTHHGMADSQATLKQPDRVRVADHSSRIVGFAEHR
jgi:hypothetical protein